VRLFFRLSPGGRRVLTEKGDRSLRVERRGSVTIRHESLPWVVLAYATAVSLKSHYGSFIGKQNGTKGMAKLYERFLECD
jgi:hypothetical protein